MDSLIYRKLLSPPVREKFRDGFEERGVREQTGAMCAALSGAFQRESFSPADCIALYDEIIQTGLPPVFAKINQCVGFACHEQDMGVRELAGWMMNSVPDAFEAIMQWPSREAPRNFTDRLTYALMCEALDSANIAAHEGLLWTASRIYARRFSTSRIQDYCKIIGRDDRSMSEGHVLVSSHLCGWMSASNVSVALADALYMQSVLKGPLDSQRAQICDEAKVQMEDRPGMTARQFFGSLGGNLKLMAAFEKWNPDGVRRSNFHKFVICLAHQTVQDSFLRYRTAEAGGDITVTGGVN
jgi:hypothetical protein